MNLKKIHEDARGTISIIEGLNETPELTVFETKEGYARGGCIHEKSNEFCCVVEGGIRYLVGEDVYILTKGQTVLIRKNTPHYFEALTDCIVLEWGATEEEKKVKHVEFRAIVDDINKQKERNTNEL